MDLSSKAVLVSCTINMFRTSKVDKEVSNKIQTDFGDVMRKAGTFTKITMAKSSVSKYEQAAADIKNFHKTMTLPRDESNRILAIELHQEYMDGMRQKISAFENAADQFCINYSGYVHKERTSLGSMFKESDYPAPTEIRNYFGITHNINPVPSIGDFRVSLSDEELKYLKDNLEKQLSAKLSTSMLGAWRKLYDPVKDMADRLAETKKPHDSMIGNLKQILGILSDLNLGNDPKLEEMAKEVEEKLCQYSGKEIRQSKEVRQNLKAATDEIMKKMAPYAGVL